MGIFESEASAAPGGEVILWDKGLSVQPFQLSLYSWVFKKMSSFAYDDIYDMAQRGTE